VSIFSARFSCTLSFFSSESSCQQSVCAAKSHFSASFLSVRSACRPRCFFVLKFEFFESIARICWSVRPSFGSADFSGLDLSAHFSTLGSSSILHEDSCFRVRHIGLAFPHSFFCSVRSGCPRRPETKFDFDSLCRTVPLASFAPVSQAASQARAGAGRLLGRSSRIWFLWPRYFSPLPVRFSTVRSPIQFASSC
jgi:hypothetical protein